MTKNNSESKSMSKLTETNELVDLITNELKEKSIETDVLIATFLGDMAVSLAMIADAVGGEEKGDK